MSAPSSSSGSRIYHPIRFVGCRDLQPSLAIAVVVAFAGLTQSTAAQTIIKERQSLVLEGERARVIVDLAGGSIASFHLQRDGLNPLQWEEPGDQTSPRPIGHFLCLDRWGAPSAEEQKNGMPFHGEAARVIWQTMQAPVRAQGMVRATMAATLPLAGLKVKREITLSVSNAFFVVREEVTNTNKLGRIFNMVQHPTIGPPFLDEQTMVDANAGRGFMQSSPLPNPEDPAVDWPEARRNGQPTNIRHLTDNHDPNVVSYTIEENYGWVTASSPKHSLIIGYIWKTSEYPWLNLWRHSDNGKPFARGLEFGTTGLHQPFAILVAKRQIFGRALYQYLDANEAISKSYACFLFKVPQDYKGVARLTYDGKRLQLRERETDRPERELSMDVGQLFGRP
jgi:hypothetical protein